MTWETWGFIALAAAVLVVAALISRGRLDVSFEPPYAPPAEPADPIAARSGIEWSQPADDPHERIEQHHPRTTGETADGRHEAQDR